MATKTATTKVAQWSGLIFAVAIVCLAAQTAWAQGSQVDPGFYFRGPVKAVRSITFNGRALTPEQQSHLEMLERYYGIRLPDDRYWYDNRSGAMGLWNGPALSLLPAGLDLGGPMPANASGGGTRVFINGRELHPIDVARLAQIGPVYAGRFWLDANGDFGMEGGPKLGNLVALSEPKSCHYDPYPYDPKNFIFPDSDGKCSGIPCVYPGP